MQSSAENAGPSLQIIFDVAFGCAMTGYAAMFLWGLIFQSPTVAFAEGTLPYALLPAATGGFYGFHLDNVELGQRPSRLWEIGSQALATTLCGLVAAPVWLALGGVSAMGNFDFVILVALLGLIVGGSLAWYLPQAAANRRSRLNHAMQVAAAASLPEKPPQPAAVLETSISEQPTYLAA